MYNLKALALALSVAMSVNSFAAVLPADVTYVPLQFRTVSGIRPFVEVEMGGKQFLMKVHSNARLNMMTTHANAAKAGVTILRHKGSYGISKPGEVSPLGLDSGILPKMKIAGREIVDSAISVFEIPQDPPVDGMLGSRWLRAQRVIVDYDLQRFGLPASSAANDEEDQGLVNAGYIAHPFIFNEKNGSFQIEGEVDGVKTSMALVTVAENIIDIEFAREANIPVGPVIDNYGGPGGAVGQAYIAKRMVDIVVDGQRVAPDRPQIYDTYAYESETRSVVVDNVHRVRLGADFLLANRAVIDFGTNVLFLRPTAETAPMLKH